MLIFKQWWRLCSIVTIHSNYVCIWSFVCVRYWYFLSFIFNRHAKRLCTFLYQKMNKVLTSWLCTFQCLKSCWRHMSRNPLKVRAIWRLLCCMPIMNGLMRCWLIKVPQYKREYISHHRITLWACDFNVCLLYVTIKLIKNYCAHPHDEFNSKYLLFFKH